MVSPLSIARSDRQTATDLPIAEPQQGALVADWSALICICTKRLIVCGGWWKSQPPTEPRSPINQAENITYLPAPDEQLSPQHDRRAHPQRSLTPSRLPHCSLDLERHRFMPGTLDTVGMLQIFYRSLSRDHLDLLVLLCTFDGLDLQIVVDFSIGHFPCRLPLSSWAPAQLVILNISVLISTTYALLIILPQSPFFAEEI